MKTAVQAGAYWALLGETHTFNSMQAKNFLKLDTLIPIKTCAQRQNLVEFLWASSPMDKAGLKLGDMVWSVEKNDGLPPEREKLETQLTALVPGQHALYMVNPPDRDAGLIQMKANHSNNFNPKRKRIPMAI